MAAAHLNHRAIYEPLRERFEDLKSDDLSQRRWKYNTSGGSTGEPVRFIQDQEYEGEDR